MARSMPIMTLEGTFMPQPIQLPGHEELIAHVHLPSASSSTSPASTTLLIFLNGLALPASSWQATLCQLRDLAAHKGADLPHILLYDRYGQGQTPKERGVSSEDGYNHGFMRVVQDLQDLIQTACKRYGIQVSKIVLVAHSIGCLIARLYCSLYPGSVAALFLLDSNIARDYSDIWPDPAADTFDVHEVLSPDCPSVEHYTEARKRLAAMFDLDVKNAEGLDRRDSAVLLPRADEPRLTGPGGAGPFITVVGHDPLSFARISLESMGTPISLTEKFTNAYWADYNARLLRLTSADRARGVIVAAGCGHFIQVDDPSLVARETLNLLARTWTP